MSDHHLTDDEYVKVFSAEDCATIQLALQECYRSFKDHHDEWHRTQSSKIKQLLEGQFGHDVK
ncbi:hypothetical protein [Hazenella coriacea]|uniref:Uncharacterized protein n=1 Tax=Hazenella coriacea TaxID=1179467 RepID=A0A4R3LCB4_9BACL|nr:hypothetical protein [Hazenella coriacea]TCS95964.1 hypothetical protein EDD58_102548 [Hazenella coriacea]